MSDVQNGGALPSIEEVAAKFATPAPQNTAPEVVTPEAKVEEGGKVEDTVAEQAAEVNVEETPKAKKDPASSRFAALARKEKELRNQMSSFERRMQEMEAREQAIREREERLSKARRPMDILKETGFTYADVTQDLLGQYKEPEPDPLDQKIDPLRKKWDEFEPNFKAVKDELETLKSQIALKEQQETYQKTLGQIKDVLADTDKYELTNAMGDEGLDLVQEVILEYWRENEILLDFSEACDIVEKYYEDDIANRLLKAKKIQSRVAPPAAPVKAKPAPKEVKEPTTLTQGHTTASQATVDLDSMSHHDAIAYLAKKLQFK